MYFDLGFQRATRPYLVTLRKDERSPFELKPKGFGEKKDGDKPEGEKPDDTDDAEKKKDDGPKPVQIDFDGIERRIVQIPEPEARYTQIAAIKGKDLIVNVPVEGALGYDTQRYGGLMSYPDICVRGPMVCLTNEYAGSDGDIFSRAWKMWDVGPLVGTRTWGGVVAIWPRHRLADGTVTTQPEFSFWFNDVGFNVENHGRDPHREVEIRPQDYVAGRDPQMEKVLELEQQALAANPPQPPQFVFPDLAPKPLPPRA